MSRITTASLSAIAILIFPGCNNTTKQRNLAVAAAIHFQALYNAGSCQQLYDNASPYFKAHETGPRWLRDCAELRNRFGALQQFTPATSNSYPFGEVGTVWVRGAAQFVSGPAEVRLDWDLTNDHAALSDVLIQAGGEQVAIPGFTGEIRN